MMELQSPYKETDRWLRGNLHTHTTKSDGERSPENVIADYAARGYDFLAISDHDTFVDPVEYRDETGLVLLSAVEVSGGGPHLLHIGADGTVEPKPDRQAVIDTINDQGGIAVPAHPNWKEDFAHWGHEDLIGISGHVGLEIYNGGVVGSPGSAIATDRWDRTLSLGHRIWGFATDDSHRSWEVGRGWIEVQVAKRTPSAILEALVQGQFYATTGILIQDIQVNSGEISIRTSDAHQLRLISDHGVVQQTEPGPNATFRIPEQLVEDYGRPTYLRVECVGHGGDTAWTQPVFISA